MPSRFTVCVNRECVDPTQAIPCIVAIWPLSTPAKVIADTMYRQCMLLHMTVHREIDKLTRTKNHKSVTKARREIRCKILPNRPQQELKFLDNFKNHRVDQNWPDFPMDAFTTFQYVSCMVFTSSKAIWPANDRRKEVSNHITAQTILRARNTLPSATWSRFCCQQKPHWRSAPAHTAHIHVLLTYTVLLWTLLLWTECDECTFTCFMHTQTEDTQLNRIDTSKTERQVSCVSAAQKIEIVIVTKYKQYYYYFFT